MRVSLYGSLNTWPLLCTWVLLRRDVALCRRTEEVSGLVFTQRTRWSVAPSCHTRPWQISSVQVGNRSFVDNAGQETDDATREEGCSLVGSGGKAPLVAHAVIGQWFPVLPHPLVSVPCFFHYGPYVSFSSSPIAAPCCILSSLPSPSFCVLIEIYGVYGESLWKRWIKSVSRTFLLELIQ